MAIILSDEHAKDRISISKLFLFAFFLLSLVIYFKQPFFPSNEIFPYYFALTLLFIFLRKTLVLFTSFFLISLTLYSFIIFNIEGPIATDFMQLIIVIQTAWAFNQVLNDYEKGYISTLLTPFLSIIFLIMFLQAIFPQIQEFFYENFFSRDRVNFGLDLRTGGVGGIAPEPSYMGALLNGIFLMNRFFSIRFNMNDALISISIFLAGSLSGIAIFLVLLTIFIFDRKLIFVYVCFFSILVLGVYIYFQYNEIPASLERVFIFYELISQTGISFTEALRVEEEFGSTRLTMLVEPLTSICCGSIVEGTHEKNYSFFGTLYSIFSPFHLLIFAYLLTQMSFNRIGAATLFLSIFYGPVLIWFFYIGFFNRQKILSIK